MVADTRMFLNLQNNMQMTTQSKTSKQKMNANDTDATRLLVFSRPLVSKSVLMSLQNCGIFWVAAGSFRG